MQHENKEVSFKEEIAAMEYEPLNDVELKLCKWSMGLGVIFLVIFYVIAQMVPGAH